MTAPLEPTPLDVYQNTLTKLISFESAVAATIALITAQVAELDTQAAAKDAQIVELNTQLTAKDAKIAELETQIAGLEPVVESLYKENGELHKQNLQDNIAFDAALQQANDKNFDNLKAISAFGANITCKIKDIDNDCRFIKEMTTIITPPLKNIRFV